MNVFVVVVLYCVQCFFLSEVRMFIITFIPFFGVAIVN